MSQESQPAAFTPENEKGDAIDQVDRGSSAGSGSEIDLLSYHELNAGRLIVDPECVLSIFFRLFRRVVPDFLLPVPVTESREARIELGEKVASQLKLTRDGSKVLWPQPTDSELSIHYPV